MERRGAGAHGHIRHAAVRRRSEAADPRGPGGHPRSLAHHQHRTRRHSKAVEDRNLRLRWQVHDMMMMNYQTLGVCIYVCMYVSRPLVYVCIV